MRWIALLILAAAIAGSSSCQAIPKGVVQVAPVELGAKVAGVDGSSSQRVEQRGAANVVNDSRTVQTMLWAGTLRDVAVWALVAGAFALNTYYSRRAAKAAGRQQR